MRNYPARIHIGIDASGDRGLPVANDSMRYYTIAGVTCSNLADAEDVASYLDRFFSRKKGKHLHLKWKEIIDYLINNVRLQYYIFFIDKMRIQKFFGVEDYRAFSFPGVSPNSKYNIVYDEYAKHGWLLIQSLIDYGYSGPTEIRVDRDLSGLAWEDYKRKVSEHAITHVGVCDIQDASSEYPLVRIADLIANFVNWQLTNQMISGRDPLILSLLEPHLGKMDLELNFGWRQGKINRIVRMEASYGPRFIPW